MIERLAPPALATLALLVSTISVSAQDRPPRWTGTQTSAVQPASFSTGTVSWVAEEPVPPGTVAQAGIPRAADNRGAAVAGDEMQDYHIRLTPPGPEFLFNHRFSESQLFERIRQDALSQSRPERIEFPKQEGELTRTPYQPRAFQPKQETVEPNYTAYQRLKFEQINFERYGWDLGIMTPFVCAGVFFKDVIVLPYHTGTEVCRRYEVNSGYCLPGQPVPLMLYPPEASAVGALFEGLTVAGLVLIFP